MSDNVRLWKWAVIVLPVLLSIWLLYPPRDTLKPGIDLAGGTSLIYEIDDAGLSDSEKSDLSERVINVIRNRVDPNNQFNIVWRPIGNTRIEIQMPRPPKDAAERRRVYEEAREKVRALNIARTEVERALALSESERQEALDGLVRGVDGRKEKLADVESKWLAYLEVRGGGDYEKEYNAFQAYDAALEDLLLTNLSIGRLSDVLALRPAERQGELTRLLKEFPSYKEPVEASVAAYDAWDARRGSLEDPQDLKRLLRGAGVLEFRILAERNLQTGTLDHPSDASLRQPVATYVEQLQARGPRPRSGDRYQWFQIEDPVKFLNAKSLADLEIVRQNSLLVVEKYAGKHYVLAHVADKLNPDHGLTQQSPPWSLKRAFPGRDFSTGRPTVQFQLDAAGGLQFADVTRKNLQRELAIFLDGMAMSHATIESQIGDSGQIRGDFTQERVLELVRYLEAGALPARLKETPLLEKNVGPSLGERNREMGMKAAMYGLIAVAVFMLAYYWFAGILADIALMMNLLFVLAIMAAMEATFTLPGIAGLLLTVGMAVDANVLIYERIREELARGVILKKAVKLGYEKALSTIVDANLTTLITCVILGYVGSEEIKGFAMTLGFGIVTSMFTALFATRLVLTTMINLKLVKSLPMGRFIGRVDVDWIGLKRIFWPVSATLVVGGAAFFVFIAKTDPESVFDIEFLGGTSVQIEMAEGVQMSAEEVRTAISGKDASKTTAISWLLNAAEALEKSEISAGSTGEFVMTSPTLSANDINVLLRTTFEDSLALGGFAGTGNRAVFATRPRVKSAPTTDDPTAVVEEPITLDDFQAGVKEAAEYTRRAAQRLNGARIQTVSDVGAATDTGNAFEIVTVESNQELVRVAAVNALGEKLRVERPITYEVYTDPQSAPAGYFAIEEDDRFLGDVIGGDAPHDILEYRGGVALVFDKLDPPQTTANVDRRIKEMRLQPQYEQYEARDYDVLGVVAAGANADGETEFSRIAIVVRDDNLIYGDDPGRWEGELAQVEMEQAKEALSAEKSLRKVVQFAPQIASRIQHQALISLILALLAIVAYVWLRFGSMQYGLAAIVALVHDVAITLGIITLIDELDIGGFHYRIDLAMVGAILTVVGYSLNDTIVIFDRIRENRGKSGKLTTNLVNNSINMTLSRTILTSLTTLIAVGFLFVLGGPGVAAFSFTLIVGIIAGTYSTVAIAAPLLQSPFLLHCITYLLVALTLVALAVTLVGNLTFVIVVGVIAAALLLWALTVERRSQPEPQPA